MDDAADDPNRIAPRRRGPSPARACLERDEPWHPDEDERRVVIVDGTGLVEGTTVLTTDGLTHATLSARWTAATGTVALRFRADQRNYRVHFELPVP